jgi:NAD(P)-dependent dehydrogenase (short-subunit alcohol dehydrogenase family)
MRVDYDFSGCVVLVTGGASGIGAATARACAAAGAAVVTADVRPTAGATVVTADVRPAASGPPAAAPGGPDAASGGPAAGSITPMRVDVSDPAAVKELVEGIERRFGRIDAAVLAAAIQQRCPVDALSDEQWRRHLAVNLDGVFYCIRALAPLMRRQRRGAILAFTSGLATLGWPGAAAYAASKAALVGLAKCAALELRDAGVRVNLLSPGLVATPIFLDVATPGELAMYESSVGVSQPEDVVPTVLHLISDASAGLTGAVVERRMVPSKS